MRHIGFTLEQKSEMTKTCFVSPNIYPLISGAREGFGGAELEIYNIAKKLSEDDDFEIKIITITKDLKEPTYFGKILVVPVTPYMPIKKRRGYWLKYIFRFFKTLWNSRSDIYFSTLASLETVIVWMVSQLRGKKFFFRVEHDWETNCQDLKNKVFSGRSWLVKLFLFSLKRADVVIAQTKKQKESLKINFNIDSKVIYNAHYIPNLKKKDRFSILWVGRAHPMKRPEMFLELAKSFPEEKFVMIMSPNRDYKALLSDIKEKSRRVNNLEFIAGVPLNEIIRYYQIAKMFVLTSEAEGFSNVIIEALKTETPVVSLSIDPGGILMSNKIGFYAEGNFNRMVGYVSLLLEDEKIWQEYSNRAYNFTESYFDIKRIIVKYKEILKL